MAPRGWSSLLAARLPYAMIRLCFASFSFVSASAILLVPVVTQAQDADEGGEHLVLSRAMCGKSADTPSMSQCLQRQNEKADRWLSAVVASYARYCGEAMADMTLGGNVPFDQVAQLRKSQATFDLYREEAALLAGRTGLYGMSTGARIGDGLL